MKTNSPTKPSELPGAPSSASDSETATDSSLNSSVVSSASVDFGQAVLNYSCDERFCHVTSNEFELVEFDPLFP